MSQKIRIKLQAYDHNSVDKSAGHIIKAMQSTGTKVKGPIPLPSRLKVITVNKSPHVYKKSREQFGQRIHKRIIDIYMPTSAKSHDVLDALMKIELQAGVDVDIKE